MSINSKLGSATGLPGKPVPGSPAARPSEPKTAASARAGQRPGPKDLIDPAAILKAYESLQPDPGIASHRVAFGTSGHRGSSLQHSFNENHILAITQAICDYRAAHQITGPIFVGFDTHALSLPAFRTTIEVLAANQIPAMIAKNDEFTPTPVVSHAIVAYNTGRTEALSDGIVITPSHNPPGEGGFKYNPPHGGPAEKEITDWIQNRANQFLESKMSGIKKIPYARARQAATVRSYDYIQPYVTDLNSIIDFDSIRDSGIKIGVDPLGGAGVHYWPVIADHYRLNMQILNPVVDPRFQFMALDWDGEIRMDPSSKYAMRSLIEKGRDFDIAFACDTDHDRHGIVTKSAGLMAANDFLATSIFYLFGHRLEWSTKLQIGKTLVSSQMIDRVGKHLSRGVYEVPVGFKWFVEGLSSGRLGFAGEESAGATFLKRDGRVWTTDKDGFVPSLLAAEMTATQGKDPAQIYDELTRQLGKPFYSRTEGRAGPAEKKLISDFKTDQLKIKDLAGDEITRVLTRAPGNNAPIGGVKFETKNGWLAVRPSGTEDVYKIYGESFVNEAHLQRLLTEGQAIIDDIISR